ncbi:LamG domain-containing protein [Ekhidna sp.]|jgi:hypothetical protein|uniref:LamG domain-containing protein n=1 Tax=Ekhidna sp. TaxID=2608089 RepID=UPI0032EFDCED
MIQKFRLILFFTIITLFISCKDDDRGGIPSNEVIFGFTTTSISGRLAEEYELTKLYVTIEDESGLVVYDNEIFLNQFDENYESDPISLNLGSYQLEAFFVLDTDSVVRYATPKEGSELAYLVNKPLPIHFVVSKDDVTHVVPEVISTDEGGSFDFGYSSFSFNVIETFDLLLGVFAFDYSSKQYELTDANLTILNEEDTVMTDVLFDVTNKIVLSERYDSFNLIIEKSGYNIFDKTFTIDSLRQHDGTNQYGPLEITLEQEVDITTGLVAYYPFNGNANDESVNSNHGSVNGASLTEDRNGVGSSAYSFDGVDDYIDLGGSEIFSLGNYEGFAISAWVKSDEVSIETPSDNMTIFSKYIAASDNRFYNLYIVADHDVRFATWSNGSESPSDVVQADIGNEWNHITLVSSDGKYLLYLNGVLSEEVSKTFDIKTGSTTAHAMIGAVHHSSSIYDRIFNGSIDEVRIYDRAINSAEVDALFND